MVLMKLRAVGIDIGRGKRVWRGWTGWGGGSVTWIPRRRVMEGGGEMGWQAKDLGVGLETNCAVTVEGIAMRVSQ